MNIVYNIKMGVKKGYETHLGRALKITWGVFNIAWIALLEMSIFKRKNPIEDMLFYWVCFTYQCIYNKVWAASRWGVLILICSILLSIKLELNPLLVNAIAAF